MRDPKPREAMTAVSAAHPCPVCAGDHKCSVGDAGLILCGRRDKPVLGFRHLGPSRGDHQFHLYRADDGSQAGPVVDCITGSRIQPHSSRADGGCTGATSRDWPAVARECAGRLTPDSRRLLAEALGLPVEVLAAVPLLGVGPGGRYWTLPECDAGGVVVGISRRFPDGSKKLMAGGRRGLTLAEGWHERPGLVLAVEGASDTLALTAAGLCAVGRPSNTGGVELLARLLRNWPADHEIVVVGENDRKPDGSWPGRDGAERTAARLARDLGRPVGWALPPVGAKDVRDWLTARVAAGIGWADAGRELLAALTAAAVEVGPAPGGGRPEIVIGVREHEVNDQAAAALGSDPDLYRRGGALVRVLVEPAVTARAVRRPAGPRIDPVLKPTLRERLTRAADWFVARQTEDGTAFVPAHPPDWCVAAVHARGDWPSVRRLEAVVEYPVLLPGGRVPAGPGFDPDTGLLYAPPDGLTLDLPDPTLGRVRQAVEDLAAVVADFPFEADAHRAAWVAALLTPLARFAFPGPAPLFLVDANARGAGKGLLLHALALVVTGEAFTVATYTPDADELRKRITALALEGDRLILFDNLEGKFGNAVLDAALTSTAWKDRLLGQNKQVAVPLWATWYATGNNVAVAADTARRVCHVRLETPEEHPEGRGGFRHPDLLGWVWAERPRLLSAALTVLRGYVRAGRPDQWLPAWGSFEGWSGLVRSAVVWAGLPDPAETRTLLQDRSDVAAGAMAVVVREWHRVDPDGAGVTAAQVIERVYGKPPAPNTDDLRDALDTLLPRPDGRALGYKLRHHRRRVFGGRYLDHAGGHHGSGTRWAVFAKDHFAVGRAMSPPPGAADPGHPAAWTGNGHHPDRLLWGDGKIGDMIPPDPEVMPDGRPVCR